MYRKRKFYKRRYPRRRYSKKLYKRVNYLAKKINRAIEKKHYDAPATDTWDTGLSLAINSSIDNEYFHVTAVPQGTDYNCREGLEIHPKSISIKWVASAMNSNPTSVPLIGRFRLRVIVSREQESPDSTFLQSHSLQYANNNLKAILSPYNVTTFKGMYKMLYDKVFSFSNSTDGGNVYYDSGTSKYIQSNYEKTGKIYIKFPPKFKIRYSSSAGTLVTNGIYVCVIGDIDGSYDPGLYFFSRLNFTE